MTTKIELLKIEIQISTPMTIGCALTKLNRKYPDKDAAVNIIESISTLKFNLICAHL